MTLVDLRERRGDTEVRRLLDPAPGWMLVGWEEDGVLVGCAGLERTGDDIALRWLAVLPERRGRGCGRALLDAVAGVATAKRLVAKAEGDAARFLLACGFSTAGGSRYERPIPAEPVTAPPPHTLDELSAAIRSAWSGDTSDDSDWSEDNPALGQCAVTALAVQELLGGEIVTANVTRDGRRVDRHAWNRLPSGLELDLTRSQYCGGEQFEPPTTLVPLLVDRAKARLFSERVRTRL